MISRLVPAYAVLLLLLPVSLALVLIKLKAWLDSAARRRSGNVSPSEKQTSGNGGGRKLPLPPGPRGLPLLGNVLRVPKEYEWLTYHRWAKQYGDILLFHVFRQPIVVLSSWKSANDLLNKRSAVYSDRPRLVMAGELLGYEYSIPLMPRADARHRESRRLLAQVLGPRQASSPALRALEARETVVFLGRLLDAPKRFEEHVRVTVASKILQISHGYRRKQDPDGSTPDPLVRIVNVALDEFARAATPGAFLVDFLPFLKHVPEWVPGAGWKRLAREWAGHVNEMRDEPYRMVQEQVAAGTSTPSFASHFIELENEAAVADGGHDAPRVREMREMHKWAVAGVYGGGADTTVSALTSFFLAMARYPHVQERAQVELDRVLGAARDAADGIRGSAPARLPKFDDRDKLPYVEGVLREVLRWNPVGPLGIAHRLREDDEYEGHRIPGGTVVIPNSWAMLHDPEAYPDPDEFEPTRYERMTDACGNEINRDPHLIAFGYGRRVCPGIHIASNSLWLTIASVLAMFDISPMPGCDPPPVAYTSGVITHPKPFQCQIKPRSERATELVRSRLAVLGV